MELRHLRYFVAVADAGSLSRAAEKLFVAQPPLSVQMRQLEDAMGTALLERHAKGVRLTAAGAALLPEARALLAQAAGLRERVALPAVSAPLTLAFVPSASSTVLPALVRHLRQRHPGLRLALREMISSAQVDALANVQKDSQIDGQIDAGLARSPLRHPRLAVAQQMADPFCLALPQDHPAARATTLDLAQHADDDFVGFTRHLGPAYFDQCIRLCGQAGFSPRLRFEASTVHGVLDLVGAGLGLALVPASAALLAKPGVRVRGLAGRLDGPGDETLVLLRRKADAHPLMADLEAGVAEIFAAMRRQLDHALGVSGQAPPGVD